MYKRIFFHSLLAGVLSAIACIIYDRIYFFATQADFSKVINTVSLIAVNLGVCLAAGAGCWISRKLFKKNGDIIFNFTFSILSFASVMLPIAISLPLDI
ncbi:MAG: hypothetical protein ABI861_04245, partial [Panacibacter sp.]